MKQVLQILVLLLFCQLGFSQPAIEKKIDFIVVDLSLDQALVKLSQLSGVNISFNSELIKKEQRTNLKVTGKSIKSILNQLLKNTDLNYELLADEILIVKRKLQRFTISGVVADKTSGETLIGANIYLANSTSGTVSNNYGFFSLTLNAGQGNIIFSYLGFEQKELKLNLTKDTIINVSLSSNLTFPEVVVTDTKSESINDFDEISTINIDPHTIKDIPALGGEPDVLRATHLMPGIQSGGDGLGGIFVRGGNTDQNLVLLDGVPVYNPTHVLGLFSIFNTRAIRSAELIKGGFPARYGGRLSSVLDVHIKEGNRYEIAGDASIGLIAASASIEGPFAKGNGSFYLTGRRSLIDLLLKPVTRRINYNNGIDGFISYFFYDFNGKTSYQLSKRDKLFFSFYGGGDTFNNRTEATDNVEDIRIEEDDLQDLDWGNTIGSLRYNRVWGNKIFSNLTLTFSRYQFQTEEFNGIRRFQSDTLQIEQYDYSRYNTSIEDFAAKIDVDYFPNISTRVKFGLSGVKHTFRPRVITINEDNTIGLEYDIRSDLDSVFNTGTISAIEMDGYIEGETHHTEKIKSNIGVHLSGFLIDGETYISIQPRVALNVRLKRKWFIKSSFSVSRQYLHLLTRSGIGLPTDLWVPTTQRINPQDSWITVFGFVYKEKGGLSLGVEAYYKRLTNILAYQEGTIFSVIDAGNWEDNVAVGDGEAYGLEFEFKKQNDRTKLWLNYTLGFADRTFNDINFGRPFPYRYDRRHFIKFGIAHNFNSSFGLSLDYVYGTGNPITIATNRFEYYNDFNELPIVAQVFGEKNSFRMPAYHRLDMGMNFLNEKTWGKQRLSMGIYNAYGRKNPLFISLTNDPNTVGAKEFTQVSLVSAVPYITYSITF